MTSTIDTTTTTDTTNTAIPREVLEVMSAESRAAAGFSGPLTDEQRRRAKLIQELVPSTDPVVPEDERVRDELRRMSRDFDDAVRLRQPDGLLETSSHATSLAHFKSRYPPFDYGVPGTGNAQVKQAFAQNGNVFVNSLSGHVTSGVPGRVWGISTVGIEATHETVGFSDSGASTAFAHVDWGVAWDMAVTGGVVGPNPWCEVHVRLNLLVFDEHGYVTGSGPQEVVGIHHENDPGPDITHWAENPSGSLTLKAPVFALPPGQKRWVNLDLYVEANCGETALSRASCWAMSSVFLRSLRFFPL